MISIEQFGNKAMSASKQAMPEVNKFDGPGGLKISAEQDRMAANSNKPLPHPGFDS